ncbi:MAG: UDP-N-acetylmuramate dehydrogenase [Naasia sp.]|nr:UDP-N-acetylmuramate dehydrogenase [Naasia sp.]
MTDAERRIAELTTLRVGGPAERILTPTTRDELVAAALEVWADGEPWLVVGGGSNLLVSDHGFPGTVLRTATRGIAELPASGAGRVRLRVEAGEDWDTLVAATVERGLAGMEALSGIPGSTGAAPIQNVGAYGQDAAGTLVAVEFLDYLTGDLARIPAEDLGLGYRTSVFKHGREGVVTAVEFDLAATGSDRNARSAPVRYAQLACTLGIAVGESASVGAVRDAVLALRRGKGMVVDAADPDSVSAGSFFTNPIVTERFARTLPADAPRFSVDPEPADVVVPLGEPLPAPPAVAEARVKLSAAWLIERSGIRRGFALAGSRAAISGKHTLALTNRGGATAEEIAELARYVQSVVRNETGVLLQPEPVLVGLTL